MREFLLCFKSVFGLCLLSVLLLVGGHKSYADVLQPGQKAQLYVLLDFDGDVNFPNITWQHPFHGLNAFTGVSLGLPPHELQNLIQRIIGMVKHDYAPFDNVHFVTDTRGLAFWYTWGIDDSAYIFSVAGSGGSEPQMVSPISSDEPCPESPPHGCRRLHGKVGAYPNTNEKDQFGNYIYQPLFARTFAGSFAIPEQGPSESYPPLIYGNEFRQGPGDIDVEYIAKALANNAAHEIAHLFRVTHPPSDCDTECANDLMVSEPEWKEARNNKHFFYPPVLDRLRQTLSIAATADNLEPNNDASTASLLRRQQRTLTLHDPFDEDFIKYVVPGTSPSSMSITISHEFPVENQGLRQLVDVDVMKNGNRHLALRPIDQGWQIEDSEVKPGDEYLIRVYQLNKRLPVQYRLQVGVWDDVFEANGGNNSAATATLWPSSQVCDFSGLSISNPSDIDYYRFNSLGGSVEVDLIYDPSYGDLELNVNGEVDAEVVAPGVKRYGRHLEEHAPLGIYDVDRDITWLRDTTHSGKLTYEQALDYVGMMNNNRPLGGRHWRLPKLDSTTNCFEGNCRESELGHLYYEELGNEGDVLNGGGLINRGPFANLDDERYWFENRSYDNSAYVFNFFNGFQTTQNVAATAYAWLVHDGDLVPVAEDEPRHRHTRIVGCGHEQSLIRISGAPVNYNLCVRRIPAQAGCPGYVAWTPFSGSGHFTFHKRAPFSPELNTVTAALQRGMFVRKLSEDDHKADWQLAAWIDYGHDRGQAVQGHLGVPKGGDGSDGRFSAHVIARSGLSAWYQKQGSCTAGRSDIINCNADAQCDSTPGSADGVCSAFDISTAHYEGSALAITAIDVTSGTDAMFWNVNSMDERGTLIIQAALDSDGDCIPDDIETATGTDPFNDDSDQDGLLDGEEDSDCDGEVDNSPSGGGSRQEFNDLRKMETDPRLFDSDDDGLSDGLERGLIKAHGVTHPNPENFIADTDPLTTTDPINIDTDGDGRSDGEEDANRNGRQDSGETSPLIMDGSDNSGEGVTEPPLSADEPSQQDEVGEDEDNFLILMLCMIALIISLVFFLYLLFRELLSS